MLVVARAPENWIQNSIRKTMHQAGGLVVEDFRDRILHTPGTKIEIEASNRLPLNLGVVWVSLGLILVSFGSHNGKTGPHISICFCP